MPLAVKKTFNIKVVISGISDKPYSGTGKMAIKEATINSNSGARAIGISLFVSLICLADEFVWGKMDL